MEGNRREIKVARRNGIGNVTLPQTIPKNADVDKYVAGGVEVDTMVRDSKRFFVSFLNVECNSG